MLAVLKEIDTAKSRGKKDEEMQVGTGPAEVTLSPRSRSNKQQTAAASPSTRARARGGCNGTEVPRFSRLARPFPCCMLLAAGRMGG